MISFLNPLRFRNTIEEDDYYEQHLSKELLYVQIACFLAGVIFYLFFVWDANVDPSRSRDSQMLRGLVGTPVIWLATCLSFLPIMRKHNDFISCTTCIFTLSLQIYIDSNLNNGIDYGVGGIVLILLFTISFLKWRLQYYVVFFTIAVAVFVLGEFLAGSRANSNMFLPNMLVIVSAVTFCLFAAVTRERIDRKTYRFERELIASRAEVDRLLNSFAQPAEIERLILDVAL